MSAEKVQFGILGVAKINERLLPGFHASRYAAVSAIASRNLDRAQQAAQSFGIPRSFGSYEELLSCAGIDAVYIPLPNAHHAEWVRRAADAGKHILCEKPLTPTAGEAQELVEYCRAKGVLLMDGFMWPHHPRTKQIRDLINNGVIGPISRVCGAFTFQLPLDPANIRLNPEMGGGSLLDVGCYPVYGIRWAFGAEPVAVYAKGRYDFGVDLEMSGILWFEDGRQATFDCGFTQPLRQWLEITGTTGVIRVPQMWLPDARATFYLERDDTEPEVITVPGHHQIACMLDNFSRAVLEQSPIQPDPEEAVKTLRVLDALALSASEGREVDI